MVQNGEITDWTAVQGVVTKLAMESGWAELCRSNTWLGMEKGLGWAMVMEK